MSASTCSNKQQGLQGKVLKQAVELLSQQIWCWGKDILHPEGNWLLEIGFERVEPPADRETCASVYTLELPQGRRVILRGFGVFYGDDKLGGIFMPRYGFLPKYTAEATLDCPPWSADDMPKLKNPTQKQRPAYESLTKNLIDWIHNYETTVIERLGIDYRKSTLTDWDNGKRYFIQAEEMAESWREISQYVTSEEM